MSKFYKEGKEGKFVTYLYEDTRTLYEGFRRGAKESSKSLSSVAKLILESESSIDINLNWNLIDTLRVLRAGFTISDKRNRLSANHDLSICLMTNAIWFF